MRGLFDRLRVRRLRSLPSTATTSESLVTDVPTGAIDGLPLVETPTSAPKDFGLSVIDEGDGDAGDGGGDAGDGDDEPPRPSQEEYNKRLDWLLARLAEPDLPHDERHDLLVALGNHVGPEDKPNKRYDVWRNEYETNHCGQSLSLAETAA